jgi:ATP-dependent 26S proteasome regulatory subunit
MLILHVLHCTGKTLLARALASNINATFLKVVASAIVDKYIGESARVVREMFGYAKDHQVRRTSLCLCVEHLLL